jgi:acetolactate synthase-1/2/3 large subunit
MADGKRIGAHVLAEMLHAYGVSHVFYTPCLAINMLAAMEDLGTRRIITHGEKAAAYMADGFARASGRPAVCMSQHIGASNLAAGLRDAYLAGSPVIALAGSVEPPTRFRNGYQSVEDVSQFDAVTKASLMVDTVDRIPDLVRQAFRHATSGAPGPVHLGLRGRIGVVIDDPLDDEGLVEDRFSTFPAFRTYPDPADIKNVIDLLARAKRPIIVAGGGVTTSGAGDEVVAFATKMGIPVATSLNAKHIIPDHHPLAVGVIGTYSRKCANMSVAEADLVIFIGSRTGGQTTFEWKIPRRGAKVVQIDIDPAEIGRNYPNSASVLGDAKVSVQALSDAAGQAADYSEWCDYVAGMVKQWREEHKAVSASDAVPMRPERICSEISELLPQDAILVSDTGHSGIWSGTMIELRHAGQRYIRCAGSMGWGLPGAIGVKFAEPNRPVVLFTGDGALYYHIAELETAARHNVKLIVVVNNNSALSQEMPGIKRAYGNEMRGRGPELYMHRDVNFAEVARNMGCIGIRAETPAEFRQALVDALQADGPVVIDAVSDLDAFPDRPWA